MCWLFDKNSFLASLLTNLPFVYIWEPRGQWKREEVERVCRELQIIPCLDPFGGDPIRGDLLYLRLHGKTDYRYTYSEAEMKELIRLGEAYLEAYTMFNNMSMYKDAGRLKVLFTKNFALAKW